MSLLNTLLNGGPTPAFRPMARPAGPRPPARHPSPVFESQGRARPIVPRGLRRALQESVRGRESVVLNPQEAAAILRVYEELERDPFVQKEDAFSKEDLGVLGIEMGEPGGNARGSETHRTPPAPGSPPPPTGGLEGLLSPSLAMQAPEATPVEDEAPPPELNQELQAFQDEPATPEAPPLPADQDPEIMKLISGGDDSGDDGLTGLVPRLERGPSPLPRTREVAPVRTENAEVNEHANLLIEARKLRDEKKRERAEAARRNRKS